MKLKHLTSLLFVVLLMNSCEEFWADCVLWPAKAIFVTENIPRASVNQEYYGFIDGGVKNDSDDRQYQYTYEFNGSLPEGLSYYTHRHRFIIEGTPTVAGKFEFTLSLTILSPDAYTYDDDYDHSFCQEHTNTKKYTLIVRP